MNEPRVNLAQLLVPEAEALDGAGGEVLDEDIGLGEQGVKDLLALRVLEVEGEALLVAIEPDEVARHSVDRRIVAAREIAGARPFDLDHPGPEVRELPRGERRRHGLLTADDGDSRQGLVRLHRLSKLVSARTSRTR